MRLSFSIVFFYLSTIVLAGGLRGAYERLFLWYAYQAEVEMLNQRDGNLNRLTICPSEYGSGKDGTLTFNEFIEVTNRNGINTKGTIPSISTSLTPPVDSTAQRMAKRDDWVRDTWQNTKTVISGTVYNTIFERAAKVVWQAKAIIGSNHPSILRATDAIQKVVISRKIDYEEWRMPAMESAPEFTGENKVKFETWEVVLASYGDAREFDLDLTIQNNKGQENIAQRVDDWVQRYHSDTAPSRDGTKTEGEVRSGHFNALRKAQRAESMVLRGSC
ncbi:hypothetical protein BJX96DRAFT_177153 [Aspergillus floccosus]